MYAVLILSPLPSVIPFGEKKKINEIQHKKKKEKKIVRCFWIRAPADCGYIGGCFYLLYITDSIIKLATFCL